MKKHTTAQRFGAAMRYAIGLHKRGFQSGLARTMGKRTAFISDIVARDKNTTEDNRRALYQTTIEQTPSLSGISYDGFLLLGDRLLYGGAVDASFLESLKVEEARGTGFHAGRIAIQAQDNSQVVANTGVNNGTMQAGVSQSSAESSSRSQRRLELFLADVRDELSAAFPAFDADDEAALRARLKNYLPELGRGRE